MPFHDIIGHTTPISWLQKAIRSDQLAHAYLFVGDDAIGKRLTALQFMQAMNCDATATAATPDACGCCQPCLQIASRIHPDVLFIQPDEGATQHPQIKIELVREIEHHVVYRPLIGLRKICLIDDADRLTIGAANALLKTLEEPPDHCLFILITSRPAALLSTLRSRCLVVRFSPPSQQQVVTHLMKQRDFSETDARFISLLTNARLGEALSVDLKEAKSNQQKFFSLLFGHSLNSITEAMESAEGLSKSGKVPEAIMWLWSSLRDLLLLSTHCSPDMLLHRKEISILQPLAQRISPTIILDLLDELGRLEQGLQRNLNMQLGLEQFFIHVREALTPSTG